MALTHGNSRLSLSLFSWTLMIDPLLLRWMPIKSTMPSLSFLAPLLTGLNQTSSVQIHGIHWHSNTLMLPSLMNSKPTSVLSMLSEMLRMPLNISRCAMETESWSIWFNSTNTPHRLVMVIIPSVMPSTMDYVPASRMIWLTTESLTISVTCIS